MASISSKSATTFFSDYWRSSSCKPTPFHLDWHQSAHILRNFSRIGRKTSHGEASHRKNEPFRRFLLVTAASLRFRPQAILTKFCFQLICFKTQHVSFLLIVTHQQAFNATAVVRHMRKLGLGLGGDAANGGNRSNSSESDKSECAKDLSPKSSVSSWTNISGPAL